MSTLRITEIFHSIQGESTQAGRPCTFVRLTGCPLRCVWCDTEYAFGGGETLSIEAIIERVRGHGGSLVEVTGGEPLAQKECAALLTRLADEGYEVLLETSGAFPVAGLDPRVRIILDVKCPDSGESSRNLWDNLDHLSDGDEVKFVIASRRDYEWARDTLRERRIASNGRAVLFSPVWNELAPGELARWMLDDAVPARLQLQLHKILFGAEVTGV